MCWKKDAFILSLSISASVEHHDANLSFSYQSLCMSQLCPNLTKAVDIIHKVNSFQVNLDDNTVQHIQHCLPHFTFTHRFLVFVFAVPDFSELYGRTSQKRHNEKKKQNIYKSLGSISCTS